MFLERALWLLIVEVRCFDTFAHGQVAKNDASLGLEAYDVFVCDTSSALHIN
jgi:hypothetical protein